MIGKSVKEISISDMNWQKANQLTQILVEEGYAVMVTLEERLIIINYTEAFGDGPGMQSDRNYVTFMDNYEFETLEFEPLEEIRESEAEEDAWNDK